MKRILLLVSFMFVSSAWAAEGLQFPIDDVRVAPLVKSHWDQLYAGGNIGGGEKCYNYYTPGQCYCGCGPTALAQIMRYHEWPRTEVNTNSFVYGFDGLNKMVRTTPSYPCKYQGAATNLTMIGGVYDWSKMPYDTKTSGTSEAEREMIGRLCYDIGVSMSADYNKTTGTGVSSPAAVHNLPGNFHYADAAAIEFPLTTNMKECTREIFEQAILPNLDAALPCGVMLSGDEGAHIVVCDGYGYHQDDGKLYVHLNVGYSGQWDGWFAYGDAWRINGHDYTVVRGIIFNISPHFNGPIVSGHVVDAAKRPLVGATLAVSRGGRAVTNVVTNARGEYNFKAEPGDYDVRVSHGALARTVYMKLEPAISSAYLQTGEYNQDPVAVRIANRRNEDIVLDAALAKVETPFSVPADGTTFTGSQLVALNCDTDGADIYYTTDGSYPTREATRYTGPFAITSATTVRAVAIKGDASSSLGTFAFVESTYGDVLGTPTTPWASGGYATWFKDTEGLDTYYVTGTDTKNRLRSGAFDSQESVGRSSWLEATIDGPAKVSFDYRFYSRYYGAFNVVLDEVTTNVHVYVGEYTSDPNWTSGTTIAVGEGVHRLRFDYYLKYRYSNAGYVHLRNMKIVYPNVLKCELPTYWDSELSTATFTDGERSNIWSQLSPTNARVTVHGTSSARKLTVDANVTLRSLVLDGEVRLAAEDGKKLTVGSVNVSGHAALLGDALDVSGAVTLTTANSTLIVADGIGLVPVSGVSGTKVVSAKASGYTTYSLEVGYASPFSAQVTGSSVRWSDLTFTDRNGNSAKWTALGADAKAQVNLNVTASVTLTMDASVSVRTLTVTGEGALTLAQSGVHALTVAETTTANANVAVNGAAAQLGAVAIADGKTLKVASLDAVTTVVGGGTFESSDNVWPTDKGLTASAWTGTLRLTGTALDGPADFVAQAGGAYAGAIRLDGTMAVSTGVSGGKFVFSGPFSGSGTWATSGNVPVGSVETYCLTGDTSGFAGTLTVNGHKAVVFGNCDAGDTALCGKIVVPTGKSVTIAADRTWTAEHGIEVAGELVVAADAGVVGGVIMTDPEARVAAKVGSSVEPTSGVEYYETSATTNGTDVTYALKIAKATHVGPYSVTVDSASLDWSDIIWSDAHNQPGQWADLESAGNDVFTINAANDVTITMSGSETASKIVTTGAGTVTLLYDGGKDVPAGMKTALQDSVWKGTVKLAGTRTFSGTDLGAYGNAGSAVELAGSISGTLKNGCRCESTLILSCTVTLSAGGGATYTFAGALKGTGEFYFSSTDSSDRLFFLGDATAFRGGVNGLYGRTVVYGDPQGATYADGYVIVNSELTFSYKGGWGNTWHAVKNGVNVNGKATIESGVHIGPNTTDCSPVALTSPSAQVLVKTGSGIVPVNGTSRTDFANKSVEGGTLYYFSSAATQDPEPPVTPTGLGATYSFAFDGDSTTASSVCGGTAPAVDGEAPGASNFVTIRDADGKKAFVVASGVHPWKNGLDLIDDQADWSVLSVAKCAEVNNGVIWGVGDVSWQSGSTGLALAYGTTNTISLVRWQKGGSNTTILSAQVEHALRQYHSYVVFHIAEYNYYELQVDGKQAAYGYSSETFGTSCYQVGNLCGGPAEVGLAEPIGFAIDEFAVWKGAAVEQTTIDRIAEAYPPWPTVTEPEPPVEPPVTPDDPDVPDVPVVPDVPDQPTTVTNRVPAAITLNFAMTSDDNMKVKYVVVTNGVSRTWEDAAFAFTESGDGRNLWRGNGNKNIGSALVKNFTGPWNGWPVPNTNLEQPNGTVSGKYWQIDVPFDLSGAYSVTNMLPKVFITNNEGAIDKQPTSNGKKLEAEVVCLVREKTVESCRATVESGVLGDDRVNTQSGVCAMTLSNGFLRIKVAHCGGACTGAFGGIQGLVFRGEIVTVTENGGGGGDDPGGDEPGGDEPGGDDPVDPPVVPVRPGWYVDASTGDDANEGRSPTNAFKTINAALGRVASDEVIYVAAGIYYESVATSYTDRRTNLRVESLQGPDVTVIDAQQGASCVFDGSLSGQELTFVGFTLQHGSSYMGGGVYGGIYSNCVVTACTASYGGGVCDAILFDSRVHGNTATIEGGGVYHASYPCELYNSYVWDNWVESGSGRTSDNAGGDVDAIVGGDSVGTEPPSNPPVEPPVDPQPAFTPGTNVVVAPLTQAMWNQGRHYNLMCPVTATGGCDGRMWAGCTAVATAIVMKYYEWPREGETFYQTLNSEKTWENDFTSIAQRARFYRPYEWSKMQDVYGNVTSAEASLAVGELLADVGAAMNMNYGADGSSTLRDNVMDVLEHNFHFDASEMYHVESGNFTPEVEKMIQAQLKEGHPIVSAGAAGASGTGHTYVCDGYEQVVNANGTTNCLYHFNFGWGGGSNGWYPLSAVFTAAKPGEEAVERPVQDMFLGVYPQKAPQIHSAPDVTGPEVRLDWSMATCWTNKVTGFRIERQDRVTVPVNEDLTGAWNVRISGWGWKMSDGVPVATAGSSFSGYWPTQGVSANTTRGLGVSERTTVTIRYQAKKFPNGVTLSLIKSDADGSETDSQNQDLPTLANLPGGTSTTAFEEKTVTVSGSTLANAFGLEPAYFALRFTDPNGDKSYYGSTEVFRLVSFAATGEGEGWETKATETLPSASRTYAWANQPTGDHKYLLTAIYPTREASASVVKTVRSSEPVQPTVSLASASGQTLTFTVANTSSYSFKFETQSNVMRGTGTQNGNAVTYAFANDVATMGTHWIALTVTDDETGASARYVHITNPPTDHPLCAYAERSVEAAAARARREGKLVLLVESGDPDAKKFMALSGILASNEVVEAVSKKYVVAETIASVPGQRTVGEAYWRGQPQVGYGSALSSYLPDITAYAVVINPETPSVPYPCDALPGYYMSAVSRWNYFNSQYDMANLGYAYYVSSATSDLVRFLAQDRFLVTALPERDPEPSIDGGEECGTVVRNEAGEYVVTPVGGMTAVAVNDAGTNTIVIPPSVVYVTGVDPAKIKIRAGGLEITSAFNVYGDLASGYAAFELNANGVVTNGNETIAVRPVLAPVGSGDLATVPFAVSDEVSVGVKTIPGLKYTLLRGVTLEALSDPAAAEEAAFAVADGTRTRLTDPKPLANKAFYRIRVDVP